MKIKAENIRNTLRKIRKYGFYIPLSNVLLNYVNRIISEEQKDKISAKRNRMIQQHLWPLLNQIVASQSESFTTHGDVYTPKIWVCWLQGENKMPPISKLCLSSIRKNANGIEVVLITSDNYKNYVSLPEEIIERFNKGQFKPAHFADIIRMNLLAQRGGLWLDSTMLVTSPIDQSIFDYEFYSIKTQSEGHFVSNCRWAVFMLACKPNNKIMSLVSEAFTHYLLSTDLFIDYFLFDHFIDMLYQIEKDVKRQIDEIPLNNLNVHKLNPLLSSKYDDNKFISLTSDTSFYKLANSNPAPLNNDVPDSYYAHLKNMF